MFLSLFLLSCGSSQPESSPTPPRANDGWARSTPEAAPRSPAPQSDGDDGLLGGLFGGGDCDDSSLADQPLQTACITETISCGQTVKGHTGGGSSIWNGDFYRSKFCTPANSKTYEGKERIYFLEAPAEVEVRVSLESDCADLDLFMVSWPDPSTCPTEAYSVGTCEADTSRGGGRVMVQNIGRAYSYLIGVEASDGTPAPFSISVECPALLER